MNYKETFLKNSKHPQSDVEKYYADIIKLQNTLKSRVFLFIAIIKQNKKNLELCNDILTKINSLIEGYKLIVYSQIDDNYFNVFNSGLKHKIDRNFINVVLIHDLIKSFINSNFSKIEIPDNMKHKKNLIKKVFSMCGLSLI